MRALALLKNRPVVPSTTIHPTFLLHTDDGTTTAKATRATAASASANTNMVATKRSCCSRSLLLPRVTATFESFNCRNQLKNNRITNPRAICLRSLSTDVRTTAEVDVVHVTIEEATIMTTKALMQIGWDESDASTQAEIMVAAELCGNNQGLVKMYQPHLMAPSSQRGGPPIVTRETAISAVINAQQSPGMIAAVSASTLVVQKIQTSALPIAIVSSYNSSTSSGQLAHYVELMARDHGVIGIAMCNSPEFVAAAPGAKPVFGTNPIAISIPLADSPYPYTVRSPKTFRCSLLYLLYWSPLHVDFIRSSPSMEYT
jgi:hypothetical protein